MSIRPVEFTGMVSRSQDISTIKQNDDNKPIFQQQNLAGKIEKDTQHDLKQVKHGEDAEQHQKKYDAKEKGNNEYQQDPRNKKKKKKEKEEGRVLTKGNYSGFDMRV